MVVFTEPEVFKRCAAPVGGFAHVSCECVCGPHATVTFCSDGWDMIARKRGSSRTAFAGTARLFASWSEIVCPREAYKLVNTFAVNLWRFANADPEVAAPVHNMVDAQPATAVSRERKRPNPKAAAKSSTSGAKQGKYDDGVEYIVID